MKKAIEILKQRQIELTKKLMDATDSSHHLASYAKELGELSDSIEFLQDMDNSAQELKAQLLKKAPAKKAPTK